MHVNAHLDVDLVAVQQTDVLTRFKAFRDAVLPLDSLTL